MRVYLAVFLCSQLFLPSNTIFLPFSKNVIPAGTTPLSCPNYPNCPFSVPVKRVLGFPFICPNFPFCFGNTPSEVSTREADNAPCHYVDHLCIAHKGNIIETLGDKTDASACQEACKGSSKCTHFTFTKYYKRVECHLLSSCSLKKTRCPYPANCASGSKECKCPRLDKKSGDGVARWRCEGGLDPYQKSSAVGLKCTVSCSTWSGLTLQSTCLPGLTWSTTSVDTSDTRSLAPTTYYKWPQPDEADPQCDDDCADLGPFTINPNKEEGAEFTCDGWPSERFDTDFTIKSGDVCQLKCSDEIVERLSCKDGEWSVNPEEGFYCFNKPEKPNDCTDLGPFTINPNKEEGAEFTCDGWPSERFDTDFTIKSGDVCQLKCSDEIVEKLSCKDGKWTAKPEDGFYCFNKPEKP